MQQRVTDTQRRAQSDLLFEKMDTTCTGLIKLEPIANYLKQYKESAATESIEQGRKSISFELSTLIDFRIVLQAYQDQPQLSSTQFFDFLINTYQTLNENIEGGEKFDDVLKYVDNLQPQVLLFQTEPFFYSSNPFV